ncbi:unnamed protein product [Brassica rapa]|uniref:Ubiquitin-like protein ATG12 n=1 Tax=Brassica campestris TaxID=3711 RepID=A0A3P5ZJ49_BRACM|nr:unnamed protein product [Brassica rapa]VDC72640.1 unnamed protein product [Brassica rapa]
MTKNRITWKESKKTLLVASGFVINQPNSTKSLTSSIALYTLSLRRFDHICFVCFLVTVVVHLRATGGAPILKQNKFKISGTDKFAKVIDFLGRQLHSDSLFVYVNSAFSPNPDESVIDLYNNFGIDGKLVVNYACSMAWG